MGETIHMNDTQMKHTHTRDYGDDYSKIPTNLLRAMAITGGLKHERMTEALYRNLLAQEKERYMFNLLVIDFCTTGLNKLGLDANVSNVNINRKKKVMKNIKNYNTLSYKKLREMLLNGELEHQYVTQEVCMYLFDNEFKTKKPDSIVINFCVDALLQFGEYEKGEKLGVLQTNHGEVDVEAIVRKYEIEALLNKARKQAEKRECSKPHGQAKRFKRFAVAGVAALVTFAIAVGFGYPDFFKVFVNLPAETSTYNDEAEIKFKETRYYDSMNEMFKNENVEILYNIELLNEYFTDFEAFNGRLLAYDSTFNLSFEIKIGANIQIEQYDYETQNGLKYNTVDKGNGVYQACWSVNGDYYEIVADDMAILSQIINKL